MDLVETMFSVKERPWHGLGNVIENAPSIEDARVLSGLTWGTALSPMLVQQGNNVVDVPDHFAVVRQDNNTVLGVVGNRYEIFSNDDMWSYVDTLQREGQVELETAGSLRLGRTTWCLCKKGSFEALAGDPIQQYILVGNSFDGSSPLHFLSTDVRVVCWNTFNAALKGAKYMFNVRHTKNIQEQVKEVQKALALNNKYQESVKELVAGLVQKAVTATEIDNIIQNVIFPAAKSADKVIQTVGAGDNVISLEEVKSRRDTIRKNRIEAVTELIETGAGTDIPGVKGTLWGVYNAITEWADHTKTVKIGNRDEKEARFENAFYGSGAAFKTDALTKILQMAA